MITDAFLSTIVKDKSFVDVGPLWVIENERLSVAHKHGANRLAAIDIIPLRDDRWEQLGRRLGKTPWDRINQDVCYYEGTFDVVHCAGVLYHHPSPLVLMSKLAQITLEHLVLGCVVAEKIGKHPLAPGAALFLPGVPPRMMQTLREDWKDFLAGRQGDVFDWDVQWNVNNLYHWWWLFTKDAVLGMAKAVGFQVRETHLEAGIFTMLLSK